MTLRSLAITALTLSAGCNAIDATLKFDVEKQLPAQTIDGSLAPCQLTDPIPIDFLSSPFQVVISQEEDFPEQNTDVQHITRAVLEEMSLALTAASQEPDWNFLTGIEIFVTADGLDTALIASIGADTDSGTPIPSGASTLSLIETGLNLAPYIKAEGGFTMTSEAAGCPPQADAIFDGLVRIHIEADPL